MTDNARNIKYIVPYMKSLREEIDTKPPYATMIAGVDGGNPTIETNCVTLHKGEFEYVTSQEPFLVNSNHGFVIQCRIPYYKSTESILYIGCEDSAGIWFVNNKLYIWGGEISLGEYEYNGGELFQQVYDGTYINFLLDGRVLQKTYFNYSNSDRVYIGFWDIFGAIPPTSDITITDICVYQSGIRGDDASKGVDCNSILSTYKEITNVTQDLQNYGIGGDYYHDKLTNKIYGPKLGLCGSLYFDYTAFQQSPYVTPTLLSINNDTDLDFRGDDFTVEWWQYTRASGNARIFSIGSYPTVTPDNDTYTTPGASISVSIEGNSEPQNLIVWINSAKYSNGVISGGHTMGTVNLYNRWAHIALVRSNTSTGGLYTVYVDGESIGNTFTGTDDLNDNRPLTIGGEITGDGNTYYSGHITNFRWSKGVARYTNNFDVPILPLTTIDSATKLLLNANDYDSRISDSSGNNKTVSSVGSIPVSWNARNPYFGYKNSNAWVEPRVVYDPPSFVTSLPLGGSTTIWDFSNNFGFNSILIYLSFAVTSTELQISNFVMVAVNRSNTNVVNFKKFDPTNLPSNVTFNVSGTQFKIVSGGVNSEYPYITVKIVALDNTD